MKKILIFLIAIILAGYIPAYSAPSVSGIAGTFEHGEQVVVSGSGFGSKSPAAPLLWDDGMDNPSMSSSGYDQYLPTSAEQGSTYNMAYRDVSYRSIGGPHNRMSYMLGAAHATQYSSGQYYSGGNVGIGKNITSHTYFINYFYRVDPDFDEENGPGDDNMKELVLSDTQGEFYPDGWGAFGYANWCSSDVPDENNTDTIKLGRMPIDPDNQSLPYGCSGNNLVYHNNPVNGWIKMQWEGEYNSEFDGPQIVLTTYPDGERLYLDHYGDGLTVAEYSRGPWANYPKEDDLKFIGLGGFARVPRLNNGLDAWRYFAGIYMDSTHSRIMLGDNSDYDSCTKMEPLIPSVWSSSEITATVNLGNLSGDTGYLYVFDSNNDHNSTGYTVNVSSVMLIN